MHAAIPLSLSTGIDLIDVDLAASNYRPAILAENVSLSRLGLAGDAYSPSAWLARRQALAVVNGGYFGRGKQDRKEIIGLFVKNGRILRPAPPIRGQGGAFVGAGLYVRSAFGITREGNPQIAWASTPSHGGEGVYAYVTPNDPHGGRRWNIQDAIGCGPMLVRAGRPVVTDHQERLVDDLRTARTFVAYDTIQGHPRHFVIGVANAATYKDLAQALIRYYARAHGTKPARAMCVDGGSSSQLSYKSGGQTLTPLATSVAMPTAIAIVPAGS